MVLSKPYVRAGQFNANAARGSNRQNAGSDNVTKRSERDTTRTHQPIMSVHDDATKHAKVVKRKKEVLGSGGEEG